VLPHRMKMRWDSILLYSHHEYHPPNGYRHVVCMVKDHSVLYNPGVFDHIVEIFPPNVKGFVQNVI